MGQICCIHFKNLSVTSYSHSEETIWSRLWRLLSFGRDAVQFCS